MYLYDIIKSFFAKLRCVSIEVVNLRVLEGLLIIVSFILNKSGREYGVSRIQKMRLALKIWKNNNAVSSLSSTRQHIVMADEILRIPKNTKGDIVECGCYNGASTVNLSLLCALSTRRLFVCDSFEGLPKPKEDEKYDINPEFSDYYLWEEGEFYSEGGMEQVRKNIEKYGNIEVCTFIKGYFNESLKNIDTDRIVLIFEDADLKSSVEDCLLYLWPKLQEGCKFYSHEAFSLQVVSLFFDKTWWMDKLKTDPPGFYGSGCGALGKAGLGYAMKFDAATIKDRGKKRIHKGSKGYENPS